MPPKKNNLIAPEAGGQDKPSGMPVSPAQAALDHDEGKFKFLFDHSVLAKSFTLPTGEMTVNQAFCDLLGYTQAEFKKRNWQGITHPDDLAQSLQANRSLLSGEKDSVRITKRYLHKSGALVWADVSASVCRDEAGRPLYILSEITDITECKQEQDVLRLSEEKWRSLVSASPDYIALHDPEGHYLFLNRYAEGFTEKDTLGASLYDYLLPESVPLYRSALEKALQTWTVQHFEMVGLGDGGSRRIYENHIVPMRGKDGLPYTLAVARDITERKQADTALQRSEERLREVLENSLDASYKRDLKTNTYEYFSPVITRLSGHTPDELKSLSLENVLELIHPDDRPEVDRLINEGLSGAAGAAWQVEYRFKNKQGQYCWFQDHFSVMRDPAGKPVALIGSISDITERKQTEEALLQKVDELERFQRLTVRRELRMIEMKKEINALLAQAGLPPKYVDPSEN